MSLSIWNIGHFGDFLVEIRHIWHGPVEISTGVEISAKTFLQDDGPDREKHF